jgi:hypothetical protein
MSAALDRQHRKAQRRLGAATEQSLRRIITGLPEPESQSAMTLYSRSATPLVAGAQTRSAGLALAYMGRTAKPQRTPSLQRALRGVIVTTASPVATSPVLRLWAQLEEGVTPAEAALVAASYAWALASNDLAVAERGGLDEGASASGQRIIGWRKEVDPDCCDWCQLVANERLYSSADSVPFHERDQCSAAPVLEGEGE